MKMVNGIAKLTTVGGWRKSLTAVVNRAGFGPDRRLDMRKNRQAFQDCTNEGDPIRSTRNSQGRPDVSGRSTRNDGRNCRGDGRHQTRATQLRNRLPRRSPERARTLNLPLTPSECRERADGAMEWRQYGLTYGFPASARVCRPGSAAMRMVQLDSRSRIRPAFHRSLLSTSPPDVVPARHHF